MLAAWLLPCAAAQALVQPGESAANQYTETLPTTGGGAPTRGIVERSPQQALGKEATARLEELGADGAAAAALAAAAAPVERFERPDLGRAESLATRPAPQDPSGVEEVTARVFGLSTSGGLGLAMPLLCLAAVVISIAYLGRQRRRTA